ncbi:MAG: hypothetical protein IT302_08635 [Dehalococcoidia bacterium]|nr:hypothetical protein [Dehalococcoidia bacterium]
MAIPMELKLRAFGILTLLFVGVAVVSACDSNGDDATTPSPTSMPTREPTASEGTSTPTQAPGVSDEFRRFVPEIEAAVDAWDLSFFEDRAETTRHVCGETDQGRAGDLCEKGEEYDGLEVWHWPSDAGGPVPIDAVIEIIDDLRMRAVEGASDEFGGAPPVAYAIGRTNLPQGESAVVLTAIVTPAAGSGLGTEPRRVAIVTHWTTIDGEWRLTHLLRADASGRDLLAPQNGWATWEVLRP